MTFDPDALELPPEVAAFLEALTQKGFAIESGVPYEYFGDVIVSAKKSDLALRLVREKSIWDLDVMCVGVPYATYYWRVCMNDMSFEQAILPFEARLTWALQNLDVLAQLSSSADLRGCLQEVVDRHNFERFGLPPGRFIRLELEKPGK